MEVNPSDPAFANRLSAAVIRLDSLQSQYHKVKCRMPDAIKKLMTIDKEMCAALDSAFMTNVSGSLDISHIIAAKSVVGPPVWTNVVIAVVAQMSIKLTKEAQKVISKYKRQVKNSGQCRR